MADRIEVSLIDGIRLEIRGDSQEDYEVRFTDGDTGLLVYRTVIKPGSWSMPSPRYYVNWHVTASVRGETVFDFRLDLKGKRVFIDFGSKALGDSVAWIPYCEEFRKRHGCEVHVKTFWNELLKPGYPDLKFHEEVKPEGFYALYRLGAFDSDYNRNRNNWRLVPLQQIPSDILGLPFREVRPNIKRPRRKRPIPQKYVAISEFSTFQAKHWLFPNGWQEIVDWLVGLGYKVMSVSREKTGLSNVVKRNDRPIWDTVNNLQHAEAFICPSCGLAPLAWALDVPTVLISGFSMPDKEMSAFHRVINRAVCHGCGNDPNVAYDRGNWGLCPRNARMVCSTAITPDMVKEAVAKALAAPKGTDGLVLFLAPHCSTGGGPQWMLRAAEELLAGGRRVAVVEYHNLSNHYTVQRDRLRNLADYHILDGDKAEALDIIDRLAPEVVHVQEFPERWCGEDDVLERLYREDRPYRIVETTHSAVEIGKRWRPDGFVFVSPLHLEQYGGLGIPATLTEYPVTPRQRPPRDEALRVLGLDPARRHVLHVGLWAKWKNQAEAIELARRFPQHQFHFVGNQPVNFKDYWEPLMEGLPDNCVVWGERADVDQFYAALDVFLFPSTMECSPIVVREALSWGMPVLMRNLEAYRGMFDSYEGIHFYETPEGAATLLARLLPEGRMGLADIYCKLIETVRET